MRDYFSMRYISVQNIRFLQVGEGEGGGVRKSTEGEKREERRGTCV